MSSRVQRGLELLGQLPGMLEAAGMPARLVLLGAAPTVPAGAELVTVTNDARQLSTAPARPGVVLLEPAPGLTFPTPGAVVASWQLVIVAGPPSDEWAAFARLDAIVEAFRVGGLPIEDAVPGMRATDPDNPVPLPGYTLTVPMTIDDYS